MSTKTKAHLTCKINSITIIFALKTYVMNNILSKIKINVNENIYLKDPESSELGRKIIQASILLIDKIGFEAFTFRKLGQEIDSPEASIYRYFENKQKLLIYLTSWYWGWMEYRLMLLVTNIPSAERRLENALQLITSKMTDKLFINEMDCTKLHQIVISESTKSYLTKEVDVINKEGVFLNYKQFVARIVSIINEINPAYKYPNMLVSTVIEGAHLQVFFGEHLPALTNKQKNNDYITQFYTHLVLKTIAKK